MGKKVLMITTSLRRNSNSTALAEEFVRGAESAGHTVESVHLKDIELAFCRGCLACQKTGRCVIKDGANAVVEKMREAEVIAFSTPIYYYEMSGQMKTMLDRANPLFPFPYSFRDIYLLTTAAEADKSTPENAVRGLMGWIACFEKARLAGTVFGGGADSPGEIQGNPALREVYEMGGNV